MFQAGAVDTTNFLLDFKAEQSQPVVQPPPADPGSGWQVTTPQTLHTPEAGRIEADHQDAAITDQHALGLPQRLMRIVGYLKRVRHHHQVDRP